MPSISHITLGNNDTERAARFYDEVLSILGFQRLPKAPGIPPAYENGGMPTIYLYPPDDGRPATWGNGTHVAFIAQTKQAVHDFHAPRCAWAGCAKANRGHGRSTWTTITAAPFLPPWSNKFVPRNRTSKLPIAISLPILCPT
jgi:catechol 2,3-dioxygenase-like lactoylglutathione lyase family enzyme